MLQASRRLKSLFSIILVLFYFLSLAQGVHAQNLGVVPTPGNTTKWVESPVVTEAGKNADRARQLLFWVFSHPPVYSAPVLSQMWAVSRNVAYAFVVITIIMFAVGFVLAQRRGIPFSSNMSSIIMKIGMILLYITFSYVLVLLVIQFSEILMRFFIEHVGGKDLFNIVFAGQNKESNYTKFVGYWDTNRNNWEMRNTSLFFIKLTGLTYNVMTIMLVLRQVILWFLLIVSPFLALLMPFILIRNTGWIWIGVFFQWIFYGPLFALFLAGLTKIWVAGIPYPFDFSRRDAMVKGQANTVYPTSINILWGGPAQTLSFNNSANYVDTYAEYVIALIMLWTATFLPWLLLRIFRDYCCDIIAQNHATLVQILDRIRSLGGPTPPPQGPSPTTTAGQAVELPFRKAFEMPQKAMLSKLTDIQKAQTREISQALNLSITSIQDIAEHEMNEARQQQVKGNLDAISNPSVVKDAALRDQFSHISNELNQRAQKGDEIAQRVVAAAKRRPTEMFRPIAGRMIARPVTTPDVAHQIGVPEAKVKEVLKQIPMMGIPTARTIQTVSKKTGVTEPKIKEILHIARPAPAAGLPITAPPPVTVDDYEEVKSMWMKHYGDAEVPVSDKIKTRKDWIKEDVTKLTNVINMVSSTNQKIKEKGIEEVGTILPFLLLGGFSDVETVMYLKAKLAAAKDIQVQLEAKEAAKEEVKEELEKEEELVEVGGQEKRKEEKTLEAEKKLERELPEKKENEASDKKSSGVKEDKNSGGGSSSPPVSSLPN